jgi:putative ABC transport system ATP-binding protein
VKFLNNFLNQMAPLIFYSFGGYLVIQGDLTAGALAAALTAHKDMSSPWKELLDYYQQTQDAKIKYEQVTDQFHPQNMVEESLQAPLAGEAPHLTGAVQANALSLVEDGGTRVLDAVHVDIPFGQKVALVGPPSEGKEAMAMLLARLAPPSSGRITIGGVDLATINEAAIGARLGYIGQSAHLFATSVRENLLYGLRQRPIAERQREATAERERRRLLAESRRAGNLDLDGEADWIDRANAGRL